MELAQLAPIQRRSPDRPSGTSDWPGLCISFTRYEAICEISGQDRLAFRAGIEVVEVEEEELEEIEDHPDIEPGPQALAHGIFPSLFIPRAELCWGSLDPNLAR